MTDDRSTVSFSPDQLRAEAAVRRAAKAGNAEAQFRLGVMYGNGDGVRLDYDQALAWFEKAAAQNHQNALITMAWMFASGAGVETDEARARDLYLRAAELGSAKAQYVVGTMYRFAQYGLEKDLAAAVDWYVKAADQGMPTAQLALGKMLMEGKGVMRDDAAALQMDTLSTAARRLARCPISNVSHGRKRKNFSATGRSENSRFDPVDAILFQKKC